MKQLEYVLNNEKEVLLFLKSHYPMYHLSNFFFRDVQYGIQTMFERRGEKLSYIDSERIAQAFVEKLEKEKIFNRIDRQSWVVNYPEYKKPAVTPAAPAKPAPGAAPAKSAAVAGATPGARPPLPPLGSAKPVGAKPALPALANAKPVVAKTLSPAPEQPEPNLVQAEVVAQPTEQVAEQPKAVVPKPAAPAPTAQSSSASPAAPPPGQRKPLPPIMSSTPAGTKK